MSGHCLGTVRALSGHCQNQWMMKSGRLNTNGNKKAETEAQAEADKTQKRKQAKEDSGGRSLTKMMIADNNRTRASTSKNKMFGLPFEEHFSHSHVVMAGGAGATFAGAELAMVVARSSNRTLPLNSVKN